jgi:hypothetical protein
MAQQYDDTSAARAGGDTQVDSLMARRQEAYATRKDALAEATRARADMARLDAELLRAGISRTGNAWW